VLDEFVAFDARRYGSASVELSRGAILAASINVVCRCFLRCFDSGLRCTALPELFSAPHNPQ